MLMVELMIIPFHLKLDKFYCIGVMNKLKVICYNLFFLTKIVFSSLTILSMKYNIIS